MNLLLDEKLGLLGDTKLKCTMNKEHVHCTLTHVVEAGPLLPLLADDGHLDGVGPLVVARLRHAGKVLKNSIF